jgi:hypothetical protein
MQSPGTIPGIPNTPRNPVKSFAENFPYFEERNLRITGTTRDSSGNPLGGCSVVLFDSAENTVADSSVSDASGNYILNVPVGFSQPQTKRWKILAYKPGSPDVVGATVNTLTGS